MTGLRFNDDPLYIYLYLFYRRFRRRGINLRSYKAYDYQRLSFMQHFCQTFGGYFGVFSSHLAHIMWAISYGLYEIGFMQNWGYLRSLKIMLGPITGVMLDDIKSG